MNIHVSWISEFFGFLRLVATTPIGDAVHVSASKATPTLIQVSSLALSVASMSWSRRYARFLAKSWFPNIDQVLVEDMVSFGSRLAETQAVGFTILGVLVNLVAELTTRTRGLADWQVWFVAGVLLFCIVGLVFAFTILSSVDVYEDEAISSRGKRVTIAYRTVAWLLILLGNLAVLGVIWTI